MIEKLIKELQELNIQIQKDSEELIELEFKTAKRKHFIETNKLKKIKIKKEIAIMELINQEEAEAKELANKGGE